MKCAGVLVGVAAYGLSCASGTAPRSAPAAVPRKGPEAERALPIPQDLQPRIAESIEIGRALYLLDKASAIGTDVVPLVDDKPPGL